MGALQVEYSLFTRDIEAGVLPALRELGIACVAYGVLSRGLITGAITGPESFTPGDFRPHMPRFQPGNLQRNLELVANIKAFGADRGMTPAQVALAWLVSRGTDVVPLVGTRRRQHLMEAVRGFEVTLSPQDIRELEALVPAAAVAGSRYPEPLMAQLNK